MRIADDVRGMVTVLARGMGHANLVLVGRSSVLPTDEREFADCLQY